MNPLLAPRPAAPLTPSIPELAAMPVGLGFDPEVMDSVARLLAEGVEALATAGPHNTLSERMIALVHAYFVYRAEPRPDKLDGIVDAWIALGRSRILADVQGNA